MSSVLVEVPEWACALAHWEVHIDERIGAPNVPIEVSAGSTLVQLDAVLLHPTVQAVGCLEVALNIPSDATIVVSWVALRALEANLLLQKTSGDMPPIVGSASLA